MGLLFSLLATQLNVIHEVLSGAKLVVWDGLLHFLDCFLQPWRNAFWFCFNIYVCLWSEVGSLIVKILLLPVRIYNAIQNKENMEEELQQTKKLYTESLERVQELECELKQALDASKLCKDHLEKVKSEERAVLKKVQVLQLHVMRLEEESDVRKAGRERLFKEGQERNILALQQFGNNNRSNKESYKNKGDGMERCSKDKFPLVEHAALPIAGKVPPLQFNKKLESFPGNTNKSVVNYQTVNHERWQVAIFSSMFSILLTLLVGTIAWQAEDPCVPLVAALFMVVLMSLKKVAQFLSSIYRGPGLDAVALLSFNFFLLGTLAYPVLPRVASTVAPYGTRFGHWFFRVIGVTNIIDEHFK